MYESINLEHTLYAIYLQLKEDHVISVGKLGVFHFPKGVYVYIGSAKRNINNRIERHKRIDKKQHWHFDYLRPYGIITKIITYDQRLGECQLAENIRKKEKGEILIRRFGSSDCHCSSHLIFVENRMYSEE